MQARVLKWTVLSIVAAFAIVSARSPGLGQKAPVPSSSGAHRALPGASSADDGDAEQEDHEWGRKAGTGRLEPVAIARIRFEPRGFDGALILSSILESGEAVEEGAVIATCDDSEYTSDYDTACSRLEAAETAWRAATIERDDLDRRLPLEAEKLAIELERARMELNEFATSGRADEVRRSELGIESAQARLDDSNEELAQLLELYKGNELAKESEEIVVKRSRRSIAMQESSLAIAKRDHQHKVEREMDLKMRRLEAEAARLESDMGNFESDAEMRRLRADNEVSKADLARTSAQQSLDKLFADGPLFEMTAPFDGIFIRGDYGAGNEFDSSVKAGQRIKPGMVVGCVIDCSTLTVTLDVPFSQISKYAPSGDSKLSLAIEAMGKDDKGRIVEGRIVSRSILANRKGNVPVRIEVSNSELALYPGLTVSLTTDAPKAPK